MQDLSRIVQSLKGQTHFEDRILESVIELKLKELHKKLSGDEKSTKAELRKTLISQRKTKKRWAAKEMEEGSSLQNELQQSFAVLTGKDGLKLFQEKYKVSDYQEYKTMLEKEIQDWANDEDSLFFQFKYFDDKKTWQKDSAMDTDIKVLCLKEMLEDENKENQKPVVSQLNSWVVAIDATSRMAFPETEEDDGKRSLTINLPGGASITQELALEEAKGDVYSSQLVQKLMNNWDLSILRFVLYKLAEQKYRDRDITTTRGEILRFMNEAPNGRNYEKVEASIKKLIALTIFINSPNNSFSLRFFENYDLTNKGRQETLFISLNRDVYTQALNGKITSMYKDVIDSLSAAAAAMIYRLQRLRIQRHYQKESPIVRVDINFFKTILVFNNQRKDRIYKSIESSLNEIVEMNVTLRKYTKIVDGVYELEFLPLSPSEMNDLSTFSSNSEQFIFPVKKEES